MNSELNVIISHDVDHIYGREHWLRDLHYPKLIARETINLAKGRVPFDQWRLRCGSIFYRERHNVIELLDFDSENDVCPTFFFGMAQGLGMSYKPNEARDLIHYLKNKGAEVGVHGICYDDINGIRTEKDKFNAITGIEAEGIRMHYVRYDDGTFSYLAEAGYMYDSTEFDKVSGGAVKSPYKVGDMWEFPICLMDSYLPEKLDQAKDITIGTIENAREKGIDILTILFHDIYYSDAYRTLRDWYEWLVYYLKEKENANFISFKEAIDLLENRK